MHLSLFFTSLLLLAEQTILIYAVLTPNSIIDRVDTAIDDVVNAIDDVAVINGRLNINVRLLVFTARRLSTNDIII